MALINLETYGICNFLATDDKPDSFIEVDELIAPVISILNKKGYKTVYSCSGHPYMSTIHDDCIAIDQYILFDDNIVLPSCPKNYKLEISNYLSDTQLRFCIRYNEFDNSDTDYYRRYTKIIKQLKVLLEWAEGLPPYNKEDALKAFIKYFN